MAPEGVPEGESAGEANMLTARIRHGNLEVRRGAQFKEQYCPFSAIPTVAQNCGDWCPLFGEIQDSADAASRDEWLTLHCGQTVTFQLE